jgi:hypothetical protein
MGLPPLFRTTAQQGRLFAWLQEATLSAQPGNARANQALLPRSSPEGQESLLVESKNQQAFLPQF